MSPDISAAAREIKERSYETLRDAKDHMTEFSKETARKVDRKAHQNPWAFVGIAAFCSVVLGFILGRKTHRD